MVGLVFYLIKEALMKVKSKIVARYEDKGRLKAVATVCLDGSSW